MIFKKDSFFIDSHCHVNSFDDVSLNYFQGLRSAIDLFELKFGEDKDIDLINLFKKNGIYVAAGVHPLEVCNFENINQIDDKLKSVIEYIDIVGETGIDLFKDINLASQMESMRLHVKYAKRYNKPIVIHCRGDVDIDAIIKELYGVRFVFHCFCYDLNVAEKIVAAGGMVSFSGIVTFKSSLAIQNAAKLININHMLCETDSPFLAPVPLRGKRNEPIFVEHVYKFIALLRQMDLESFSQQIANNFEKFVLK